MARPDSLFAFAHHLLPILVIAGALTITSSCKQDARPVVSLEEAKGIAAERGTALVQVPPRSISDVQMRLGDVRPIENDCRALRAEREAELVDVARQLAASTGSVTKRADAGILNQLVVAELSRGNFAHSLEVVKTAISNLSGAEFKMRRAVLYTQLARIHAMLGDAEAAEEAASGANRLWRSANKGGTVYHRRFSAIADAVVASARGELELAEARYRDLMAYEFIAANIYAYIDETAVRAELADNLLLQNKVLESELEARKAIQLYYHRAGQIPDIDIRTNLAAPAVVLAKALLEQRRLEEAEYAARMAVFILQYDCAWPDSLVLAEARQTLAEIFEARGAWRDIIELFAEAANELGGQMETFDRLYGASTSYGLALAHENRVQASIDYLRPFCPSNSPMLQPRPMALRKSGPCEAEGESSELRS